MTHVIKRGGKKQKFSPGKIKHALHSAAREAGLSGSKIENVVKDVGNGVINFYKKKRVVRTSAIRKSIVGRLGRRFKSVASAWRRHEKKKAGKF